MKSSNIAPIKPFKERVAELDERLYCACVRICGSKDYAHDLKQETIYQALISDYDERGNLYTWLYSIAENIYFTNLKKKNVS